MSVLVLVELALEPDVADGYAARLNQAFAETRAFPGFEDIAAHRSQDSPGEFIVVERWASRVHYERYTAWRREQGVFERLATISVRPMVVRYFDPIS